MNRILAALSILLVFNGFSQSTEKYNSDYENFYRAEELFQKEQFGAAQKEFRVFLDNFQQPNDPMYIKASFYEGLAGLEIFNNNAVSLLENFLKNYPESVYTNTIYFRLGRYYYQRKEYDEALAWYNKLKTNDVEKEDQDEFLFKLGYANFEEKHYDEARNAFHGVKDGSSQYAAPAQYYYSHIAYMNGQLQTALEGFLKLEGDERFKQVAPYYITQIRYLQKDYQSVIDYAPTKIDSISPAYRTDMVHIIGHSYYQMKKYDEAVPYLEEFNTKSKTTRHDEYSLGYAYFKSNDYAKSIKTFDKTLRVKDSLAQYAYYHIGQASEKLEQLSTARSAFEAASKMDFNTKIQEDAHYNFAVLSYKLDLNPYNEAVVAMEEFLAKYPNSARKEDVYQYLVNVYTTTNNYEKALNSLNKIPNKDARLKTTYQLIAYNFGVEQHQKEKYAAAIDAFTLVEKYPIDATLLGRAKFWTGDSWYLLNNQDKAIKAYKEFISLPGTNLSELKNDAYYNIGYAYLKKNDLSQSLDNFTIYTKANVKNKRKLADAYMRAGDCQYVLMQNDQAIKNYQEALKINLGYQDQALFYMAKAYGFSNKNSQKITTLLDLINNYSQSKYMMTAIQELASTYKATKEYDKSLKYYQQIVDDYPSTVLAVQSRIEIADIYFKKGNYALSETEYKRILSEYGSDRTICERAGAGLIDVYKALKQAEKALQVAQEYSCISINADDQEDLFYSPAIEAYEDSLHQLAIDNFKKYLTQFPAGKYAQEAKNYQANSHWALNQKAEAVALYKSALDGPDDIFTEFSASRVAQYLYNNKDFENALLYYDRLEKVGSKPATLFNAKLGLMRCHFLQENWASAASYAKEVLGSSQINNTLRIEAEYAKGMSNYYTKNYTEAKASLEWLVKNTTTVMMAEAKYSLCEMYYDQKDYTKSDATIKEFLKLKPQYNFWIAKGLILQTRILMIQDNLFQAEQTLKSVIDNYPDKSDGVIDEANELWNELMQLKNKTKSIIVPEGAVIDVENTSGN
ncbi:MAG: tetratricopeptide repeat protein [Bacteroidota bacterium]